MKCPNCQNDAGERRALLLTRSEFQCHVCGERLYAEPVKWPFWKTLVFLVVLVVVMGVTAELARLTAASYIGLRLSISAGITTLLVFTYFFRSYRLRAADELGARIIRKYNLHRYAYLILTAAFVVGAAANPTGEWWPRLVQFAMMAIAVGLFVVAEPERL